jgi:hypothetical protein
MKKLLPFAIFTLASTLLLFACKKEAPDYDASSLPVFEAAGFWEGTLFDGTTAMMVNRPDSTGVFYGLDGRFDTAVAPIKYGYRYTVKGDMFQAHGTDTAGVTILVETSVATAHYMEGAALIADAKGGTRASYPFTVYKQP